MFPIRRVAVILAQAAMCGGLAYAGEAGTTEAEYLGGTVKTIPEKTAGSLDLTSPSDLRFLYGKSEFKIPYGKIKDFQLSGSRVGHYHLGQVPLPNVPWRSREHFLDLSFRNDNNSISTISFRVEGKGLESTVWILKQRIEKEKQESKVTGRTKLADSWWGDDIWKTNRNKPTWPDSGADGSQPGVVGTK
jgi:hypothetical protein